MLRLLASACVNCKMLFHVICVHVCVNMCICTRSYGSLQCMNEIVILLNLTLFVYNFHTWLIVMFCLFVNVFIYNFYTWLIVMFCLFVNVLYEWSVTKKNSCVHLNVISE